MADPSLRVYLRRLLRWWLVLVGVASLVGFFWEVKVVAGFAWGALGSLVAFYLRYRALQQAALLSPAGGVKMVVSRLPLRYLIYGGFLFVGFYWSGFFAGWAVAVGIFTVQMTMVFLEVSDHLTGRTSGGDTARSSD